MEEIEEKSGKFKLPLTLVLLLFTISSQTIVNKYVLSVLKFQYPTVFISWQCGSCVFLLLSAYALGYIEHLGNVDWGILQAWAPCMFFYAGMMYCGSVSLSKLMVPIFLGLQNLSHGFVEVNTYWRLGKVPSTKIQFSMLMISFGTIYLVYSDFSRDPVAYKWVFTYIIFFGCYSIVSQVLRDIKLSHLDKACCNASFSVISLTSLSILTGEWRKSMDFPFLYYIKFHVGCICSGALCCMIAVAFNYTSTEMSPEMIKVSETLNSVIVSFISFGIFEINIMDTHSVLSVLVLFAGGITYTYFKLRESLLDDKDLKSVRTS